MLLEQGYLLKSCNFAGCAVYLTKETLNKIVRAD